MNSLGSQEIAIGNVLAIIRCYCARKDGGKGQAASDFLPRFMAGSVEVLTLLTGRKQHCH